MATNIAPNNTPVHHAGDAPVQQNQPMPRGRGGQFVANNAPPAPRQQPVGFRQTIKALFGRSQATPPAPARTQTPASNQALMIQTNLNRALQTLISGAQGGAQQLGLAAQAITSLPAGTNMSLGHFVQTALASLPANQLPDLVHQLQVLNDAGAGSGNLTDTLINEATEMAYTSLKPSSDAANQAAMTKLTHALSTAGSNPLPHTKSGNAVAGALQNLWVPIAKTQAALVKLNLVPESAVKQAESSSVSALLLKGLTPTQLKTVLSCAALPDLMRLINETSSQDPLHQTFKAELQAREKHDLQSFQTIVSLFSPSHPGRLHALTDAPTFSDTVVEMTEVWLRLQAYEKADPSFTLSTQTQQDHQDMVQYLTTQTQPDTLAADDLSDAQLGKLNMALKKFFPKDQQDFSLSGFRQVFEKEFQTRINEGASYTQGHWISLLKQANAPLTQQMPALVDLMRSRMAVATQAGAMLMDGGRHAVQKALNQALLNATTMLPPENQFEMLTHWSNDSALENLSKGAELLNLSDEEMAMLEHTIGELPDLTQQALHGLVPDGQSRVRLTGDSLGVYQETLEKPLSAKESANSTEVTLSINNPHTATIDLPVSSSFMADALRGFAQVHVDGNNVFDVSGWKTLDDAAKKQRVQSGLQALFDACGQQPAVLLKVTQFLHQGVAAAAQFSMASGTPFVKTSNGLGVQLSQESAHQATFDLTSKGNGRFNVSYKHEYEVAAITTETGARIELDRNGNTLKTLGFFRLDVASDSLRMQGKPIFDFQLQPAFTRPYPIPVTTGTVSPNGQSLTLLSSANLLGNQPLADDLHAFAQAKKGHSIGDVNHPNVTADGLVRAWDFFAKNKGKPDLTALRHFRDMLINPQSVTFTGINASQAQALSQQITAAEQNLINAFSPIVSDCLLNLNGAFGQGHFTPHQWSFGKFTGSYTEFLTLASPADLQVFRQWAMSPTGCPESLAFMDAMAQLRHNPDEALAKTIFQKFTMAPSHQGGLFNNAPQMPAGTYQLNVKGADYAKAQAAVDKAIDDREQIAADLRDTFQQVMDTTLLPAFIAHAPDL